MPSFALLSYMARVLQEEVFHFSSRKGAYSEKRNYMVVVSREGMRTLGVCLDL